ncbi:MAG: peptide deformylase [Gammaproteobacteria bacterium]|nr:peptide deformylase [Gammaproteobacteria bacterium]
MAILEVLTIPDPRLKQESQPVERFDSSLRDFIHDLEQTMRSSPGGVGIAAPQVARFERIIIVDVSRKPKIQSHGRLVLINPEILEWQGMEKGREGCMSVPDYTGNVIRAKTIKINAYDESGQMRSYDCEGYEARAIQHEVDHLDGVLFLDRLVSRRTDLFQRKVYSEKSVAKSD